MLKYICTSIRAFSFLDIVLLTVWNYFALSFIANNNVYCVIIFDYDKIINTWCNNNCLCHLNLLSKFNRNDREVRQKMKFITPIDGYFESLMFRLFIQCVMQMHNLCYGTFGSIRHSAFGIGKNANNILTPLADPNSNYISIFLFFSLHQISVELDTLHLAPRTSYLTKRKIGILLMIIIS